MRIIADNNIPGLAAAVQTLGRAVQLRTLPSAAITPEAVREADLLFVRSTVRCDARLLAGSSVRFVATATIGTDHLDLPWLAGQGIVVASAPGCNADSVVQWLAAALLHVIMHHRHLLPEAFVAQDPAAPLAGRCVGVVGVGNVGSRMWRLLRSLGAEVLLCDPPRARSGDRSCQFYDLDELCARCDLLTLHVPLLRDGIDRTVHLLDERRLGLLRPRAVLINASRGEVVDSSVLLHAQRRGHALLLDVFPGEPSPDPDVVAAATLATPHIAGHSLEGKVRGTQMVYQAACAFLGVEACWSPDAALLPPQPLDGLVVDRAGPPLDALHALIRSTYDICQDDQVLRQIVGLPLPQRGPAFRRYRETYPVRRELTGARLRLAPPHDGWAAVYAALGAIPLSGSAEE